MPPRRRPPKRNPKTSAGFAYSSGSPGFSGAFLFLCQEYFCVAKLRPVSIGLVAVAQELGVVSGGLFAVSRLFGGTRRARKRIEALRSNPQHRLKSFQRGSRLLCSEQHFSQKLAGGRDGSRSHGVLVGGIFVVRSRAHLPQGIVLFAFRQSDPGGDNFPLDVRLLRPILVFRFRKRVTNRRELLQSIPGS